MIRDSEYNDLLISMFKLHNFTKMDMNIFALICMKARDVKDNNLRITYDEIKQIGNYKGKDTKRLSEDIKRASNKLMEIVLTIEKSPESVEIFSLFKRFTIEPSKKSLTIKIKKKWLFVLEEFIKDFTEVELNEFTSIKSKYAKFLYRKLYNCKPNDMYFCKIEKIKEVLNVPKAYDNKYILDKVIKPSVKELSEIKRFKELTVTPQYKTSSTPARTLKGYLFEFTN